MLQWTALPVIIHSLMAAPALASDKYRELILFLAEKMSGVGKLKLNKLLYYIDFDHFEKHEKSVTGEEYVRWEKGPVPSHLKAIVKKMEEYGDIQTYTQKMSGDLRDKRCLRPLRPHNPNVFTVQELETICEVLEKWRYHSGTEMMHATHGDPPYLATAKDQVIDYNLVFYRQPISENVAETSYASK